MPLPTLPSAIDLSPFCCERSTFAESPPTAPRSVFFEGKPRISRASCSLSLSLSLSWFLSYLLATVISTSAREIRVRVGCIPMRRFSPHRNVWANSSGRGNQVFLLFQWLFVLDAAIPASTMRRRRLYCEMERCRHLLHWHNWRGQLAGMGKCWSKPDVIVGIFVFTVICENS